MRSLPPKGMGWKNAIDKMKIGEISGFLIHFILQKLKQDILRYYQEWLILLSKSKCLFVGWIMSNIEGWNWK